MATITMVGGVPAFYCEACFGVHKADTRFVFNYNKIKPTFKQPLILTLSGFSPGHPHFGKTIECHSEIKAGVIRYLDTSTHEMKGMTRDLLDFEVMAKAQKSHNEARAKEFAWDAARAARVD